ncbi:MAG: ComF family protein [Sulfuricellaceae bacterium]
MQRMFSQECLLCGATAIDGQLCPPCRATLPYRPQPACPICALPTAGGEICGNCLKKPPAFDLTLAAFSYTFPVDALVHSYKYAGNLILLDLLTEPLIHLAAAQTRPDLLIPMPLHPARLRERGFNQAHEIAKPLSGKLAIPLDGRGCKRVIDTKPQAGLKFKHRARNLRGAFSCERDLSGMNIALIDDVMTTGASLNELAKAVRVRGAAQVSAWVVARTLPR